MKNAMIFEWLHLCFSPNAEIKLSASAPGFQAIKVSCKQQMNYCQRVTLVVITWVKEMKILQNYSLCKLQEDIQKAMELSKCRKCECMKESLETIKNELLKTKNNEFSELLLKLEISLEKVEPSEYT